MKGMDRISEDGNIDGYRIIPPAMKCYAVFITLDSLDDLMRNLDDVRAEQKVEIGLQLGSTRKKTTIAEFRRWFLSLP